MKIRILYLTFVFTFLLTSTTWAHGASIEVIENSSYNIYGTYADGLPMSGAQVTIFAPDDEKTAYITDFCDQEGLYSFTPDPSISGKWYVQIRQSGHGANIYIDTESNSTESSSNSFSIVQIIVMVGSVVWGCIGTALYFKRK